AVHEAGLVHRDIWPANVIEDRALRGSPAAYKLIDFGIAAPAPVPKPPTAKPSIPPPGPDANAGKRGYVAPVCWRGGSPPPAASDLYALGALLFVCLAGKIPASAEGTLDEDVLSGDKPARRLSDIRLDVPPALSDLVADLLDPEPRRRPSSAELVV